MFTDLWVLRQFLIFSIKEHHQWISYVSKSLPALDQGKVTAGRQAAEKEKGEQAQEDP